MIQAYDVWFSDKLATCLDDETRPVCERLEIFMEKALSRMRRHGFRRGCLVGNLGQEMGGHMAAVRAALDLAWSGWERRMAALFQLGHGRGGISDKVKAAELAALFWTGYGAILRAKLLHAPDPIQRFARHFLTQIKAFSL